MRKNCSSDQEKLLKFEAEGREFEHFLRSLDQFIQTVKGQNNFWQQNAFLTGGLSDINTRTIMIQIGRNCWDLETCEKIRKIIYFYKLKLQFITTEKISKII